MKSLIFIEVVKALNYHYAFPEFQQLKDKVDIETFDLDNYSSPEIFHYGIDLIRKSDRCILIIQSEKDAPAGKIMLLLEEILRHKNKSLVILKGENTFVEKIISQLPHFSYYTDPQITEDLIVNFIKSER